jgi:hypothetical protein
MDIRGPSFDQTGAHDAIFASEFLQIANRPIANRLRPTTRMQRTTTCANANYKSWLLSHGEEQARQDTSMSS